MIPGGLHHGLLAGQAGAFTLNSAQVAGSTYGYDNGDANGWNGGAGGVKGSVSPSPAYINAAQVQNINSNVTSFAVVVYGTRSQSLFNSITLNGVTFLTNTLGSTGLFSANSLMPGFSIWIWSGSGAPSTNLNGFSGPVYIA